jgi:hypothetical protein
VGWNPIQEPCCAALAKKDDGLILGATLVVVVVFALLARRDVSRAARARHRESPRGVYTRATITRIARETRRWKVE